MEALVERVVTLPAGWIYAILFLGSIVESLFPVYPSDVVTLYCAFLSGRGILSPSTVFALAVLGSWVGVMGVYEVGAAMGRGWLARGRFLSFTPDGLRGAERWFERYGAGAVLASRFLPGVRALVAPAAGLIGLGRLRVGAFALCSVLLWNAGLVALGLFAGANWDHTRSFLAGYNVSALVLLIILGLGWVAFIVYRRVRST